MDSTRRRRLVRTRILKPLPSEDGSDAVSYVRPLVVFWEPAVDPSNGSRTITVRSGLEVKNKLGFPIKILLKGVSQASGSSNHKLAAVRTDEVEYGPIAADETFCVPLVHSGASSLQLAPSGLVYEWSRDFDCRVQAGGRTGSQGLTVLDAVCHAEGLADINMQLLFKFGDKGLMLACTPYAILYNHLPCRLQYRCVYGGSITTLGQQGTLEAGEKEKFASLELGKGPKVALLVSGQFHWSSALSFYNAQMGTSSRKTVELRSSAKASDCLNVTMICRRTEDKDGAPLLQVYVFSRYLFINRTGETLMLRSKRTGTSDSTTTAGSYIERRSYGTAAPRDAELSWTEGGNHVALFQADDGNVEVGLYNGTTWSSALPLPKLGASKTRFEIKDKISHRTLQLAYSLAPLPGVFRLTQKLSVMAAYTVVNTLSELIQLQQTDINASCPTDATTSVDTQCSQSWHKAQGSNGTRVRIKAANTDWSLGLVDLNEIGTTVLVLPRKQVTNTTSGDSGGLIIAHIEVKLSEAVEHSYLTIIVWSAEKESGDDESDVVTSSLSLQNTSDYPLTLLQHGVNVPLFGYHTPRYEVCVRPHRWRSFGWADPSFGQIMRYIHIITTS